MSRLSSFRRLPSPAAVIAIVALVFAVSGVAVALPGKNSVATKDIKKNAVTTAKIKNGAVKEAKLADGAVGTAKIGNDAVTGAKVNEATLGKVPSATSADTATKATSAETAAKAVSAESATKASSAEQAANAAELEGRTLSQVRPIAVGLKDETTQGLDSLTPETVMAVPIAIPTGGADVVINASMELDNETGSQAGGSCRLKFSGSVASSTVNLTMVDGHNYSLPLTAFVDNAGAGVRTALVECQGSIVDDGVDFINGDLSVQAFPIGS
jgi:hypothetical protein